MGTGLSADKVGGANPPKTQTRHQKPSSETNLLVEIRSLESYVEQSGTHDSDLDFGSDPFKSSIQPFFVSFCCFKSANSLVPN